jgi:F-type H+-transporting ATPase subunit a
MVLAVAMIVVGFIFLRGPTPHISIAAEKLWDVGPFNVTNTMFTSWIITAILLITVFLCTRRWEMVPRGVQNVVEAVVEAFYGLVVGVAGEKNGRRFFPVVATIFFFVLAANWLSLLPVFNTIGIVREEEHGFVMEDSSFGKYVPFSGFGHLSGETIEEDDADHGEALAKAHAEGKIVGELAPFFRGPNTDLNTTAALAIMSAVFVEFWGISTAGFFTYGANFFRFGKLLRGNVIEFFVGILEFISELVRLLSFSARLFGNMFAGEVVILMFTFMTPLVITVIFYGLELFVGVIQAFIFAMLTLVFGVMAVSHGEHAHQEPEHSLPETEPVHLSA